MKLLLLFLSYLPTGTPFPYGMRTEDCGLKTAHCQLSNCQLIIDTLPPATQLHAALSTHQARLLAADLAEFDDATPGQWMNYVPSLGIGYSLATDKDGKITTKPRPSISFSLSQIFSARRQRLALQAKRRSIEANHALQSQDEHRRLDELLARHQLQQLELQTLRQLHDIDRSLYQLATLDYDAAKLAPVDYLPKQKAYLQSQLDLQRKELVVKELEGEVLGIATFEGKKPCVGLRYIEGIY